VRFPGFLLKFKVEKRYRYLIQSILVTLFIYLVTVNQLDVTAREVPVYVLVLVVLGTIVVHYPNIDIKNIFLSILMPSSLIAGALLSLYYFPNLGLPFKFFSIVCFGVIYYLLSLIDNIFLVVEEREEVIPLYRVAITWSQILQAVCAIPLFSGIYKLGISPFIQAFIMGIVSLLFTVYQLSISKFDKDAKTVRVGEGIFFSLFVLFIVTAVSVAVSFVPAEAFTKGLLTAIVLMFGLSYTTSYLKNDISKKTLFQFLIIFLIFFALMVLFTF
jgi:hypothetical protein